jgi:DNA-binding transcriptional LysR family regulator
VYDHAQLRTFLTVAQLLNFTRAAQRLGLRQSTVSQHVRKLEEATGRQLLIRDTHAVTLTADGAAMVGFARRILDTADEAQRYFSGSSVRGRLRFGASDDLVSTRLPGILRDFRRDHPMVDLELTVDLSGTLQQHLAAGELDLVFAKRLPDQAAGRTVWRDRLVWVAHPSLRVEPDKPVPLILYPPPSISRARALQALADRGRAWRIACTSGSLSGLCAAALAGLGVMAHTRGLIPPGLVELAGAHRLPSLGEVEFVLHSGARAVSPPAAALSAAILAGPVREQS